MKPEQNEASTRDSESMAGLDEAREIAAQCWCDTETENIEMDARLAEAFARRLAVWMSDAARARRDADYYRGLVVRCGAAIGDAAKTCDDGSKSTDVLCTKVPELVENLVRRQVALSSAAQAVVDRWESPLWKNEGATAGYIYKLRDAINAEGVVGIGGLKIQKVDRSRMLQTGRCALSTQPQPCPFCGSTHLDIEHTDGCDQYVVCKACHARGPSTCFSTNIKYHTEIKPK